METNPNLYPDFYAKQVPYLGCKKFLYSNIPLEWFEVKSNEELILKIIEGSQ